MKDQNMIRALSELRMTEEQKRDVLTRILTATAKEPAAAHSPICALLEHTKRAKHSECICPTWARRLLPAAAALLVLGMTMSIPTVTNAIRNFFHNSFRIEEYMATPTDERESIAEYEAAIQTPDPYLQTCRVELLHETDQLDAVNGYRKEQGFDPYDPTEFAWIKDLTCEVTEVFYDGKNLYANMTLNASPLKFFWNDTPFPTEDMECFDIMGDRFGSVFETANGTVTPMYGNCWLNQERYWNTDNGVQDNDMLRAATHTDLEASWEFEYTPALPDGPVTVTMPIWVMDGRVDDFAAVGRIARITVTFTFDATEGNRGIIERGTGSVTLSGTVPATFVYDTNLAEDVYEMVYELRSTDLSGITVSAETTQRSTGLWIGLRFDGPADWAYDEKQLQQLWFNLLYDVYLDDMLILERAHIGSIGYSDEYGIELSLTASEISEAKNIRLVPYMEYVCAYQPPEEWVPRQESFHKAHPDLNDLPTVEIERLMRELNESQRAAATSFEENKPVHLPSESNIWMQETMLENCDLVITLN